MSQDFTYIKEKVLSWLDGGVDSLLAPFL